MLSELTHEQLRQTGRGTPMGEWLRRRWHPIAVARELSDAKPIMPVRVLSEGLVLFRDTTGRVGLVQDRCTHHGYLLTYGWVQSDSIVCPGHGWQFDQQGNCFISYGPYGSEKPKIFPMNWAQAQAYPVHEYADLYWAYLGPDPAPPLPYHDALLPGVRRRITVAPIEATSWILVGSGTLDLTSIHEEQPLLWTADDEGRTVSMLLPTDDSHTSQVTVALVPGQPGAGIGPAPEVVRLEVATPADT